MTIPENVPVIKRKPRKSKAFPLADGVNLGRSAKVAIKAATTNGMLM
ncbi:hypothetical protein HMPREF0519_0270 [Lentilactobacillus hilgardii DSM 20176 = ATCC 8290]|uniref:Uncharacterized protein n=1 Tax=Lentilactobacillus hilgardii (strain ATCC 8290 / DSM 20176 / CCUG 30140 / JCM 1155 / KCTC 3500 / NBRC 15886 / NCIMB 8040 / NRRL B-1843 / 9) TaxID=1423757 RepID=C0XGA9_LENH9|nr:hypothetical protein HMPREF0519_0270 [Lentilactobacillus hilgardii DSM 20176 = ATCC 8290]